MNKDQFGVLFNSILELAVAQAAQAHSRQLPRELVVELHGAGYPGVRMSPAQALDCLFISEERFYRVIDIAAVIARDDSTVMFVRASGHEPGSWHQTWDPDQHGPFKVLVPTSIRSE